MSNEHALTFDGVHHLNFSVTDLERSAAWYTEVLGLSRGWDMEDTNGRGRKVVLLHPSSPLRVLSVTPRMPVHAAAHEANWQICIHPGSYPLYTLPAV